MNRPFPRTQPLANTITTQATGTIGSVVTSALLAKGCFEVTALVRAGSKSKAPPAGVASSPPMDYEDASSLEAALTGQDALVVTLGVGAPQDAQGKLVAAAVKAGVRWIVPNEWTADDGFEPLERDMGMMYAPVQANRRAIAASGTTAWTGVVEGFWYEFSLAGSKYRYGFDFAEKSVVFYDDGKTKINTTTWPQTGRAVANLLALKVLPEDEGDRSPTLSHWRNRPLRISSFLVSQRDMFDSVLRVTGGQESDWKISYQPAHERVKEGQEMFAQGDRQGFGMLLYARLFFKDGAGNFEQRGELDNEKIGLPKEDLDEFTAVAIEMAKDFKYAATGEGSS